MKNTTIFWIHQLRFAQANLGFLEYSKGQANIDQQRLRTLIKTQKSQIQQCELAIYAQDLKARIDATSQRANRSKHLQHVNSTPATAMLCSVLL